MNINCSLKEIYNAGHDSESYRFLLVWSMPTLHPPTFCTLFEQSPILLWRLKTRNLLIKQYFNIMSHCWMCLHCLHCIFPTQCTTSGGSLRPVWVKMHSGPLCSFPKTAIKICHTRDKQWSNRGHLGNWKGNLIVHAPQRVAGNTFDMLWLWLLWCLKCLSPLYPWSLDSINTNLDSDQ